MDCEPCRHPGGCLSPLLTSCFVPGRDPGELRGPRGVAGGDPESFLADEELVIKAEGLTRASLCPEVPVAFSSPAAAAKEPFPDMAFKSPQSAPLAPFGRPAADLAEASEGQVTFTQLGTYPLPPPAGEPVFSCHHCGKSLSQDLLLTHQCGPPGEHAAPCVLVVNNRPAGAGDCKRWVQSLGWEDLLEKG